MVTTHDHLAETALTYDVQDLEPVEQLVVYDLGADVEKESQTERGRESDRERVRESEREREKERVRQRESERE